MLTNLARATHSGTNFGKTEIIARFLALGKVLASFACTTAYLSRKRWASRAAMQPVPALVMAWR